MQLVVCCADLSVSKVVTDLPSAGAWGGVSGEHKVGIQDDIYALWVLP